MMWQITNFQQVLYMLIYILADEWIKRMATSDSSDASTVQLLVQHLIWKLEELYRIHIWIQVKNLFLHTYPQRAEFSLAFLGISKKMYCFLCN